MQSDAGRRGVVQVGVAVARSSRPAARPADRVGPDVVEARCRRSACSAAQSVGQLMRARVCAMVSPMSAKSAAFGVRERLAGGRRAGVDRREEVGAAVRQSPLRRIVTAIALEYLARAHLQPVVVARADAPAVRVEHGDRERHVGGHLDAHRAVRLDWARSPGSRACQVRRSRRTRRCRSRARHRPACDTAFSMRRKRAGRWSAWSCAGIGSGRDAARCACRRRRCRRRCGCRGCPTPSVCRSGVEVDTGTCRGCTGGSVRGCSGDDVGEHHAFLGGTPANCVLSAGS